MTHSQEETLLGGLAHVAWFFGWVGFAGTMVLYILYRGKSAFVAGHAKQALGIQAFALLFGLVTRAVFGAATFSGLAAAFFAGNLGAAIFTGLFSAVVGIVAAIIGIAMLIWVIKGAVAGFKDREYRYPYIGAFVDGLKF